MLEKIPGKGGWTYAPLPEIPPMGNGQHFLPVKAAIRKK